MHVLGGCTGALYWGDLQESGRILESWKEYGGFWGHPESILERTWKEPGGTLGKSWGGAGGILKKFAAILRGSGEIMGRTGGFWGGSGEILGDLRNPTDTGIWGDPGWILGKSMDPGEHKTDHNSNS